MDTEIWKEVPGWEGLYKISSLGVVYGCTKKKTLWKRTSKEGYKAVTLWRNGEGLVYRMGRLMLLTFDRPPVDGEQANHKNGIRDDDRISNLEWVTQSENMKHSFSILGRIAPKPYLGKFGSEHNRSKQVEGFINGKIFVFGGILEASRETGVCMQNISKCCKGKRKSAGGYIWKFSDESMPGRTDHVTTRGRRRLIHGFQHQRPRISSAQVPTFISSETYQVGLEGHAQ